MISTATSPQIFVGRDEVLETLNKRVEALKSGYRQNVALTGQKLCGKTSILQHFLASLTEATVIPVYIEVLAEPFENFATKFIGTMLLNFLKHTLKDAKEDLGFLISKAQDSIPRTTAAIKEVLRLLEKENYQEAYSALFDLTTVIKEETHKPCIIILDEFHNLSYFNLKNPFAVFGKKIMVQKDTMYVVTSSQVSSIKRILKERLDLLFGNFEIIEVRDFDYYVSKTFLDKRMEGIKLPDELKDFLISFTDGRPFYLDIIASRLAGIVAQLQFKWLGSAHVSQALEDLLFDSKGVINQYFENLISLFAEKPLINEYLDILSAISEGKRQLTHVRSNFTGRKKDVSSRIEKLLEENFISKNGSIYYFNDRVFEFWLRNVYNKKRYSMVSIFQHRSDTFKKEVESLIAFFIAENKKSIYKRLEELISSFNNEVLKIDEKSLKFPKFSSIRIEDVPQMKGDFFIRVGYGAKKFWILQYSNQFVDEGIMINFIERFKRAEAASHTKILVASCGIDTNAMLIAKENKVWIWKKETLNYILSLYGKFKVLR